MTIDNFEQPEDGEPEGSGGNRLFVILAAGLAGLVVLGLVAIGGVLILRNIRNDQALAQITPVATPTLELQQEMPTPIPTSTPLPAVPTDTPTPIATNTPVVMPTNTPTESEQATTIAAATASPAPTQTPVPVGTPAGNNQVPDTGVGGMGIAAIAIGLVAVLIVSRRLRQTA